MTDIFISYARSTEAGARRVADALRALGYGVWRDDELPAHRAYAEVIEERLRAARAVVVVWSAEAVKSQWVRAEANVAREAGTLVQLRIDDCVLPLPFNEIQCADLSKWTGDVDAPGWRRVLESVDQLCGRTPMDRTVNATDPPKGAPKPWLGHIARKPRVLAALAAAALAVVAMLGVVLTHAPSAPSAEATNQRIAFFGYAVDGSDPSGGSMALARSATDRMFQTLRAFRLDAAAPTETLDTPRDKRCARAAALGARYALSGELRSEGPKGILTVQIEDVTSRTTLWEQSFSGPFSDTTYLPAMAAWASNLTLRCIVERSDVAHEAPQVIRRLADLCRDGGYGRDDMRSYTDMVSRMRELAKAAPSSAAAQAGLADVLAQQASVTSPSTRAPLLAEAEAALAKAIKLDPNHLQLYVAVDIAAAKGMPLADFDALIRSVILKIDKNDAFSYSQVNGNYYTLLAGSGRRREALDAAAAMAANDPANIGDTNYLGYSYAVLGQSATAREHFKAGLAANPSADVWLAWAVSAIFMGAGDANAMLNAPPWFVPDATVDCLRGIRKASLSSDPGLRRVGARIATDCAARGDLIPAFSVIIPGLLGDVDRTFARFDRAPKEDAANLGGFMTSALFWPNVKAVRADPRFLPLVERLGLMDYWRATRSQPDICETEDVPFCRELKKTVSARR